MGWDLKPIKPSSNAPQYLSDPKRRTGAIWGRYNMIGWLTLIAFLKKWDVDVREFSSTNYGEAISAETCEKVAAALEKHLPDLRQSDRAWLEPHIILWKTSGGYRQL